MKSVQNFLQLLNDNWISILICISLIIGIYNKTKNYLSKNKEERISIAKAQIEKVILKMVSDAEKEYSDWKKAGSIKRSQVIEQLYKEYSILSKVVDQSELIVYIDNAIDNALVELRKIMEENNKEDK